MQRAIAWCSKHCTVTNKHTHTQTHTHIESMLTVCTHSYSCTQTLFLLLSITLSHTHTHTELTFTHTAYRQQIYGPSDTNTYTQIESDTQRRTHFYRSSSFHLKNNCTADTPTSAVCMRKAGRREGGRERGKGSVVGGESAQMEVRQERTVGETKAMWRETSSILSTQMGVASLSTAQCCPSTRCALRWMKVLFMH